MTWRPLWRVEAIRGTVYGRAAVQSVLFYLDTIDSGPLESVEVLERWTAHLLY
jgi:hypothetical protein